MKTLQIGFMIPAHYPAGTSPWDVYRDFLKNPSAETWGVTLLTPDTVFEAVIAKARSAALEEAARVADEERKRWNGKAGNDEFAAEGAAYRILIAIRSLKDKDTRTPTEGDSL